MFVASTLIFAFTLLLPGDPVSIALGQDARPRTVAIMRHAFGLDRPFLQRYFDWLHGLVTLNLGTSAVNRLPVSQIVEPRLVNSLILLGVTVAILIPLAILLGTYTGLKEAHPVDVTIQIITLVGFALPEFVVGVVLILAFAVWWQVLPAVSLSVSSKSLVLPCATLVIISVGYCARMVRAGVIDVMASEYVHMARLKGMPERLVIRRHVLPNALVPSFHVFALAIAWMLGGIVIVENLFAYPGMGQAIVGAVDSRDIEVVEAFVLIVVCGYVVVNLIADVLTVLVTPRLRSRLH